MSDTPRTDNEADHPANIDLDNARAERVGKPVVLQVVPADFARQLERELNEALKWKQEDPRMLREQIRVADVAFNFQREQLVAALAQIEEMRSDAQDRAIERDLST